MSKAPTAADESPVTVARQRWRPSRAGLINVWQYAEEVLQFERGRMVLFGPNGSGKTMALELLLPYLLDTRALRGRLSTSGDDRGSLRTRITGYEEGRPRTGYLWLEFLHGDDNGPSETEPEAFTIGVRLHATNSRVQKRWFTTDQRVGFSLALLDNKRHPLSVEGLTESLAGHGNMWGEDTAGYRDALRVKLFSGWSAQRLDALITSLLVVRKQNVSDGLSSAKLSELLSDALPPLDDIELNRVANGFADLDRRRDHLAQLELDITSSTKLVNAYKVYARAEVAGVVGDVIAATTAFDNVTRRVRTLQDDECQCLEQLEQLQRHDDAHGRAHVRLGAKLDGLKSSEAFRQGAALAGLHKAAEESVERLRSARNAYSDARQRTELSLSQQDGAEQRLSTQRTASRTRRVALLAAALPLGAPSSDDTPDHQLAGLLSAWRQSRADGMRHIRAALTVLGGLAGRLLQTKEHKRACEQTLSERELELRQAQQTVSEAIERWRTGVAGWLDSADELRPWFDHAEEDGAGLDFEDAAAAVADARRRAEEPLIQRRTEIDHQVAFLDEQLQQLHDELTAWRSGKDPEPAAPPGRRDRQPHAGAPFWKLAKFRERVVPEIRDRVEAALADCRVLDAWVDDHGKVTPTADAEIFAIAHGSSPLAPERQTLCAVLEVDPAATEVPAAVVQRLLSSIAYVDRQIDPPMNHTSEQPRALTIGADGSWTTTHLSAIAPAMAAQFLGAASRKAQRLKTIAALEQQLEQCDAYRDQQLADRQIVSQRIQRCGIQLANFPSTQSITDATHSHQRLAGQVEQGRYAFEQADSSLRAAAQEHDRQALEVARIAKEHGLPASVQALDDIEKRLAKVQRLTVTFERALDAIDNAKQRLADAQDKAATAHRNLEERQRERDQRQYEHDDKTSRYQAVEETVGAEHRQVLEAINRATAEQAKALQERERIGKQLRATNEKKGGIVAALTQASERRAEAELRRTTAGDALAKACQDGLIDDADTSVAVAAEALTNVTAIRETARRLRACTKLPATAPDTARVTTLMNRVSERVGDTSRQLAGRVDITFEPKQNSWAILRTRRDGLIHSAAAFVELLREDEQAIRTELNRKQQQLFEEILSGAIRDHLKSRLWAAQELVGRINKILGHVRSAAGGVKVQLAWEIEPNQFNSDELKQAKKLLLRDSPVAKGRPALDAFLSSRIERIRADESDTGDWSQRLAMVLDYRKWHRFRVLVHHNRFGDQPRALDSRRVSLSAGEKTIVMVLPLLAAVTAHYEPAPGQPASQTPRFLLMDELFPKLDTANKRQLMRLLVELQLDVVFTSDKDRCEYDTLDAIAIHLFQKIGDDKTTTIRMVWNGSEVVSSPALMTPSE